MPQSGAPAASACFQPHSFQIARDSFPVKLFIRFSTGKSADAGYFRTHQVRIAHPSIFCRARNEQFHSLKEDSDGEFVSLDVTGVTGPLRIRSDHGNRFELIFIDHFAQILLLHTL